MNQIVSVNEAVTISSQLHKEGKRIVLTGGCFDILHIGHFSLFEHAKKQGDVLMVFLESDEKIQKLKGVKRPLHSQRERAKMISSIRDVDYVILLPDFEKNEDYDELIEKIKPEVLAITQNDPNKQDRERQAKKIGGVVKEVIPYMPEKSTSNALKILFD